MEIEKQNKSEKNQEYLLESEEFLNSIKAFYSSRHASNKTPIEIRNRRFKKLQEVSIFIWKKSRNYRIFDQLIDEGDYFSEDRIKFRDVNSQKI